MRAEDIPPFVILAIIFVLSTWTSYEMITEPTRFPRLMYRRTAWLYSKVTPGFDFGMYAKAIPLPWARSRAKYYLDGTTSSPEKDASIERFDRIYFRGCGIVLALFSMAILASVLDIVIQSFQAE